MTTDDPMNDDVPAETVTRSLVMANRYLDSVALLRVSNKLSSLPGIVTATAVMATEANLAAALDAGVGVATQPAPNDLFIGVRGTSDACERALSLAAELLSARADQRSGADGTSALAPRPHSLWQHVSNAGSADLALISVPGAFAAAEAGKALDLGMNVMIFSDNVDLEDEAALKVLASERDLLVMGPDCGTAIINGVPLGFANVVRRGPIAVVGATGTGMQEITARVHRLGSGISQAIGCGGRDLSAHVGGRTMRAALALLSDDPQTSVIVLASKPPDPAVLETIVSAAHNAIARDKKVVAVFVGSSPQTQDQSSIVWASSLAEAADLAVALAASDEREIVSVPVQPVPRSSPFGNRRGHVIRGAFVGGTFRHEASWVLESSGVATEVRQLVDFGDDEYTKGRPHPMIDPALRDAWVAEALDDPAVSVVLFDVVLGHGAHGDPVRSLLSAIKAREPAVRPVLIAHVCGTDRDPQPRDQIISALTAAGVLVADSNVEAAHWAASVATRTTYS